MDLKQKIKLFDQKTNDEDKKRIHFKSLNNFIEYYPIIKKEKSNIKKLLEEYITIVENNNFTLSKDESKSAFNLYISVLGNKYYSKHLGFTNYLDAFIFLLLIFLNGLFWQFYKSKTTSLFILFISLCFVANYFYKLAKQKVYGFRY